MAWNCTLFSNFKKRLNSTKTPTGGAVYPCLIKNDTDFIHPFLEIRAVDLSDVNYMEFNGSYYYVTSKVAHRTGVWDVIGRRDPMATYKADILDTPSLVLYGQDPINAAHLYNIPDDRIPVHRTPTGHVVSEPIAGSFSPSPGVGSFLLSVVGAANGVQTYLVTQANMAALINTLNYDIHTGLKTAFNIGATGQQIEEIIADLKTGMWDALSSQLSFGNYAQCIKACYWIPFAGFSGGVSQTIYIGDYNTGVSGLVYPAKTAVTNITLTIPWPVAYGDGERDHCMIQLYLPYCGTVALPADKINAVNTVDVTVALDTVGGTLAYKITAGDWTYMVLGANVGAPYAIGSSNINLNSVMNGVSQVVGGGINAGIGAVVAGLTGGVGGLGGIAGGITSVAGGIMDTITPQVQTAGSMGGLASVGLTQDIRLELLYYPQISSLAFEAEFGHPVMITTKPVGGYIMCKGFSVECAGTPDEIAEINAYMNTGAYIE